MQLFESYTLPSIKQQTCQDFTWLCLFDINTPELIRQRLDAIHTGYERFVPLYMDVAAITEFPDGVIEQRQRYDEVNSSIHVDEVVTADKEYVERIQRLVTPTYLQEAVKPYLKPDTEWILTTRIDNDDVLRNTFVAEVQRIFNESPGDYVINFYDGVQCMLNDKVVFHNRFCNNHFTTLCERNDRYFVSSLFYNHLLLDQHKHVQNIRTELPMFGELIHGGNVCNSLTRTSWLRPYLCSADDMDVFAPSFPVQGVTGQLCTLLAHYKKILAYVIAKHVKDFMLITKR